MEFRMNIDDLIALYSFMRGQPEGIRAIHSRAIASLEAELADRRKIRDAILAQADRDAGL